MTKHNIFIELRKLINVLQTWGNVLVPDIPGRTYSTTAQMRLRWLVSLAANMHGLDMEHLQKGIDSLDA